MAETYVTQMVVCYKSGCFVDVGLLFGVLFNFIFSFTIIFLLAK